MEVLARRIVHQYSQIKLGKINWGSFKDGFPNTFFYEADRLKAADVSFLASFDNPHTIFEQVSLLYSLAHLRPRSLRFLLPYFPTGTMERIDAEGQVATAGTLAQMLSAVSPAGPGSIPLYIWDIHALGIRHYFGPNICPRFETALHLLLQELKERDNPIIVFPDEGAYKRFKNQFPPAVDLAICAKRRDGNEYNMTLIEGDVRGRDAIIVDDLIHSGRTTILCKRTLVEHGARLVSVFATHGVFEGDSWKQFLQEGFVDVWITDSCPMAEVLNGQGPFKCLSLSHSIGQTILGV